MRRPRFRKAKSLFTDLQSVGRIDHRQTDHSDVAWQIENDPSLVPQVASPLMVAPVVLDPDEVAALLADLVPLLEASAAGINALPISLDQIPEATFAPPIVRAVAVTSEMAGKTCMT